MDGYPQADYQAMRRMQAAEAAMELRELQAYGVARREELGIAEDEIAGRIKGFLATSAPGECSVSSPPEAKGVARCPTC